MVQGKITEAYTPTIRMGATPSGLISNPTHHRPIFMPDAFPDAILPLYPGLGQASNMLACIPSGLVWVTLKEYFCKQLQRLSQVACCEHVSANDVVWQCNSIYIHVSGLRHNWQSAHAPMQYKTYPSFWFGSTSTMNPSWKSFVTFSETHA